MSIILAFIGTIIVLFLVVRLYQQRQNISQLQADTYRLNRQISEAYRHQKAHNTLRDGLFSLVNDALLILDHSSDIITYANDSATDLFGRTCIGETLMIATRQVDLDSLVQQSHERPNDVLERRLTIGDRIIQARILNNDAFIFILLHDVTVMQQLSRARREMIANISHELNTPTTTIGLLADTLLGGAAEKADVRNQMLNNIKNETQTLSQLVQEMRDLSLIESRQMPIKMVKTNLLPLARNSVEPLIPLAERHHITVNFNVPEGLVVLADENQIPRVIKNIVHNAIKFTPENGTININAKVSDDEIVISVSDTGPGIGSNDLPRIFERFFQADQSRQHGTGLGLAIARHIILGHGGQIWAENNEEAGASFFFTLPVGEDAEAAAN